MLIFLTVVFLFPLMFRVVSGSLGTTARLPLLPRVLEFVLPDGVGHGGRLLEAAFRLPVIPALMPRFGSH